MAGIITQGTTFGISVDGVAFTSLGALQSFGISVPSRPEIDVTTLLSTAKEQKFGLKDNGTISCELIFEPGSAGQVLIDASYDSNDAYKFEIEFADSLGVNGTTKAFDGYVISQNQDAQADDVLRQTVEIKIDGAITTTPAA